MKKRQLLQKAGAWILSAALTVSCLSGIPANNVNAAAPANWKDEIYIDFGTGTDIVSNSDGIVDKDLATNWLLAQDHGYTCNEPLIAGYGNWLYSDTSKDVGTVYGGASNGQKIGFDKAVPAGVTTEGGAYFRDWVFSPDGDPYTFSVDLPVGQYRVYVYTGNKTQNYHNTTFVSFGDDNFGGTYDQSSNGGGQYPATDCVYVVNVKEDTVGSGCGTLRMKVFDDTIITNDDGSYDESYTSENTVFYNTEGTDTNMRAFVNNGNPSATEGKIVTARLNGIEIQPIEEPVYAEKIVSAGNNTDIKVGANQSVALDAEAKGADDVAATERLIYTSSNPENVTVNPKTGEITGVTLNGTATITATTPSLAGDNEKSLKYNVTVVKPVSSVRFVDADGNQVRNYTMFVGGELTANAVAQPDDATDKTISYDFRTATEIAEINSETGKIQANKVGTATVRATATSNGRNTTATLTILPRFDISYRTAGITLNVGAEQKNTLTLTLTDEDPNNLLEDNVTYAYETSEPTVATVGEDGTVKALKTGKSKITVTVTAAGTTKTAFYEVNVTQPVQHATAINVNKTSITLAIKKTAQITASLTPSNSVDTLTYTPKDAKIVSVDKNGKITALKPGKTQVTVKSSNGLTKIVNVTVTSPATKVKVTVKGKSKTKLTLKKGKKVTLKAKVTPSNSTDKVQWKSSKTKIATVSKKGVVKAKKKGKTVITATAGKKKAKITITVK